MRLLRSASTNLHQVLSSPRESQILMKQSSNKVLKISRLVDFHEGISMIEEGEDEELSFFEVQQSKFWKVPENERIKN